MGEMHYSALEGFFTKEDIESFKECSQISFTDLHFFPDAILPFSGKQGIKAILSRLFRAQGDPKAGLNSKDNWYTFLDGRNRARICCLYDDTERNNALIDVMNHIRQKTGFNETYLLLRFDLDLHISNAKTGEFKSSDGFAGDAVYHQLMVSEKYMHFLGMTATMQVDESMQQMGMPDFKDIPVLRALITDEVGMQWHYYIFICQEYFDLSDWCPPDELIAD